MEEQKKTFKERMKERGLAFREWVGNHPDVLLTLIGGVCSLTGGLIKLYVSKTEYEDNLYTTIDGDVYKIPGKKMKTANKVIVEEE